MHRRQNCVAEFVSSPGLSTELQKHLKGIRDIERILGRLQNRMRNPRELGGVRDTLAALPAIAGALLEFPDTPVAAIAERIHDFEPLADLLNRGLADELPGKIDDGGTIRDRFDDELDRIRSLTRDSQQWLTEFELAEQATHRHQKPAHPLQRRLWLLHRSHQKQHRPRPRRLRAQADDEKCRALHHEMC